ncbi:hypothetical protein [uncultured Shewanella sp.]|uniref:hypothetical protein n=1 Tax=uncultured Shewanella sp. TaxID=173975 RepID=UPI00261C1F6A|nr:hypothetical protein [uncultured Shewanella sp.]
MKYLVIALVIISSVVSAETLVTDNFIIQIERECEEGNVTCDTIRFIYSPVGCEQKHTVIGKTVHTKCADGVTPCAFQGYEFLADGAKFFIHNSGVLKVIDSEGNQLLVDKGKWQY